MKTKIVLIFVIIFACAKLADAQYAKLFDFKGEPSLKSPYYSQPVYDGTYLYDMTSAGGNNNMGAVYRVKPDGSNFMILLDFNGTNGSTPTGSLIISGNTLLGMTSLGGISDMGCVFKISTNGTGYTKLLDFSGTVNGSTPFGSLTLSGSYLFGMTYRGGAYSAGCIFKIDTSGAGYTNLHNFITTTGTHPYGSLSIKGTTLFGMTFMGGVNGYGCIFKLNTSGTGYTDIFDFSSIDGSNPYGSLVISDSTMYGMTNYRGYYSNRGTIFKISLNGTNFTKLLDFDGTNTGHRPYGSLILADTMLYGTTLGGGATNYGCVFKISINGTSFTRLHDFNNTSDGYYAYGSLLLLGDSLYGSTQSGGAGGYGCMFKLKTDGSKYKRVLEFNKPVNGKNIFGSLILSNDTLYGMANSGGANDAGCIYKISITDSTYTKIADFDGTGKGSNPYGSLTLSGDTLFGMTQNGGLSDSGAIFKVNTDGSNFTKLLDFAGSVNGSSPFGSLEVSGSTLYGMTSNGGINHRGCIFKVNSNGSGYDKLLDFDGTTHGANPYGSLTLSGSVLYGMTCNGGAQDSGCIFKINTNGTGYDKLFDFSSVTGTLPYGSLILSNDTLYGMTYSGGLNNNGCIFKIKTDGSGYTKLFDFSGTNGAFPYGSLTLAGNILYGATYTGWSVSGTIFRINTDGKGFIKFMDFNNNNDGAYPYYLKLVVQNKLLYGTASVGGTGDYGVVFKYDMTSATRQITDIIASSIKSTQATLSWTNGNGEKHIAFVKEGTGAITNPINDTTYTASADWNSKGKQLGTTGYYCVYNGTGDTVTITNLPLHTTFTVQAFEYNGNAGNELYLTTTSTGNPASFITNKADPVITWSNPADIVYGTLLSGVQLNATADVPGTFAYNPVTSTLLNAGSNQPLITDFSPVDTANINSISDTVHININKAALNVTADDKSRETGADNPTFTVSYNGFVNSETESVIDTKPTASCSATALSPAGDYDIIPSGGSDNNYSFTYVNGTLTITPLSSISSVENTLNFYPNPAGDYININTSTQIVRVQIFNILGLKVLDQFVNNNSLNIRSLGSGIYTVKINTKYFRLIKE